LNRWLPVLLGLPLLGAGLALLAALLLNGDPPELRTRVRGEYLKSLWTVDMGRFNYGGEDD